MNKLKLSLFLIYSILLAGAAFSLAEYLRTDPHDPVITDKTPIESNQIAKNPEIMPLKDIQADLQCFYTGFPALDIQSVGKDDYMLSASLCDRRWQKVVNIKARDSPHNMIIGGPFIDSEFRLGAWVQYYRLYGRFGLGGGISLCQGYMQAQGGVAWMW
jgi:hypothetical protein